jgi:hypothetical protein
MRASPTVALSPVSQEHRRGARPPSAGDPTRLSPPTSTHIRWRDVGSKQFPANYAGPAAMLTQRSHTSTGRVRRQSGTGGPFRRPGVRLSHAGSRGRLPRLMCYRAPCRRRWRCRASLSGRNRVRSAPATCSGQRDSQKQSSPILRTEHSDLVAPTEVGRAGALRRILCALTLR